MNPLSESEMFVIGRQYDIYKTVQRMMVNPLSQSEIFVIGKQIDIQN